MKRSGRESRSTATGLPYLRFDTECEWGPEFNFNLQVYVDKEFIGGCDILLKMHQDGSLIEVLGEAGIRSALVADEPEK